MLLTFFITRIARQCVLSGRVTTSDGFTTAVGHLVKTCEQESGSSAAFIYLFIGMGKCCCEKRKVLVALSSIAFAACRQGGLVASVCCRRKYLRTTLSFISPPKNAIKNSCTTQSVWQFFSGHQSM